MTDVLNIFVTDDDMLFTSAIALVLDSELDMKVVGTAYDGKEAIQKIGDTQPDVVLMDVQMPNMNGIDCIKILKRQYPSLCILILTTFNEEEYIIEGLANGANGYLVKNMDFTKLTSTIREVKNGQFMLPIEVATKLAKFSLKALTSNNQKNVLPKHIVSSDTFTPKELEVLELIGNRYSNKEIAKKMSISSGTVRNYLSVIYEKLGVSNRQQVIDLLT